jgi:hypothetical protein
LSNVVEDSLRKGFAAMTRARRFCITRGCCMSPMIKTCMLTYVVRCYLLKLATGLAHTLTTCGDSQLRDTQGVLRIADIL